jgi:hypothetical protein
MLSQFADYFDQDEIFPLPGGAPTRPPEIAVPNPPKMARAHYDTNSLSHQYYSMTVIIRPRLGQTNSQKRQ